MISWHFAVRYFVLRLADFILNMMVGTKWKVCNEDSQNKTKLVLLKAVLPYFWMNLKLNGQVMREVTVLVYLLT